MLVIELIKHKEIIFIYTSYNFILFQRPDALVPGGNIKTDTVSQEGNTEQEHSLQPGMI